MRIRRPRGQSKLNCSKCKNPLEDERIGKYRYCKSCHAEYMRQHRKGIVQSAETEELVQNADDRKVIINFTLRYRNPFVNYFFLKEFEDRILFAGLPNEHQTFCLQWNLKIDLLETKDFLELARIMNNSKFFLGNQSCNWQIAEGLKIPRILESFHLIANVIPFGKGGYMFYHQQHLEYLFKKLMQ